MVLKKSHWSYVIKQERGDIWAWDIKQIYSKWILILNEEQSLEKRSIRVTMHRDSMGNTVSRGQHWDGMALLVFPKIRGLMYDPGGCFLGNKFWVKSSGSHLSMGSEKSSMYERSQKQPLHPKGTIYSRLHLPFQDFQPFSGLGLTLPINVKKAHATLILR